MATAGSSSPQTAAPLLGVVLLLATTHAVDGPSSHTGVLETKRLEIRFRPGSRSAADVDRQAVAAERDLDRIATALEATPKGPFELWLYDDLWELAEATGTQGTGGYSAGNASHVPFDNDQTRFHELVHLVTHQWSASGQEKRNLFIVEGIANAVLEFVHGVHVHAVAAHYLKTDRLPPLSEMAGAPDFYAWLSAHPGFNAYDVAGSWMRFLLDKHGTAKVRRYYTGTPAKTALGADEAALEKAWRAFLEKVVVREEVATLLEQRDGKDVSFRPFAEGVPAGILGQPEDWSALTGKDLAPQKPELWKREKDVLSASNSADEWTACELGRERYGDCAVRATVAMTGYTPVQIRFGAQNQVMLVAPGTFLYRRDESLASDPAVKQPTESATRELVVARLGKRIQVWVNGRLALDTKEGTDERTPIGVGIHKGSAEFRDVRVRALP